MAAECAHIPTPNITISRRASGHSHAIYALRRPVHRGVNARLAPLEALGRCSEWLRSALGADRGFTGVLVSNPTLEMATRKGTSVAT